MGVRDYSVTDTPYLLSVLRTIVDREMNRVELSSEGGAELYGDTIIDFGMPGAAKEMSNRFWNDGDQNESL